MNTLGVPSGTGASVALYSAEQSSGRGDSWGGIIESPGALAVNTQLAQARTISAYLVLVIPQLGEISVIIVEQRLRCDVESGLLVPRDKTDRLKACFICFRERAGHGPNGHSFAQS